MKPAGTTRRLLLAGLLLAVSILECTDAAGRQIAVIVAAGDAWRSAADAELASIYRRRLLVDRWGRGIVPVNLPVGDPVRTAFSLAILGRRPQDMQAYWNEEYFHGVSPPATLDSQEAVLRFVAATPGALGYVLGCNVDARVQVVARLALPADVAVPASECGARATAPPHRGASAPAR